MKHITCLLLAVGAVSAASVILEPYAQCGGLSYRGAWECPTGYACLGTQSDTAFPNYMCVLPGATSGPAFPYAQCGGQGFTGPTRCAAGWYCLKANDFFSQCAQLPGVTTPATPTPELADPGNFCGISATERGYPTECVPGFTCSGPGVFGYWICLPKPSTSTTTATYTKTLVTTAKSTTTKSTTTAKTTTKTTTTQKKTTTTTTKKATSTYKA